MTALAKRVLSFFIVIIFSGSLIIAQTPATHNSADIFLQLNKLNVLGSVLYIAAHPDDENNSLLPYLAKDKMYRTGYLSLTRGDGGQNLIGSEQGIELGLIRTQELLAARRMDGAEQFFTRAYEFGFSKSAEESLRIWGKEKVLSDVVWVIRSFQPDVIITRFPGDARAGHGHHAASSLLANEAYTAAADPSRFPEQLKYGVKPWQAKRILWNTFNFGGNNTTSEDQLKLEVGGFNPLLGESYGEIGGEARSMHKSQGEGRPRRRGKSYEYFSTTGGDSPKDNLMDGITIDWNRLDSTGNTQRMINTIIKQYNLAHPENSIDDLIELYINIQHLPSHGLWWQKKINELQDIIMECSGIFAEVTSDNEYAVQGEKMNLNFFVNKRNKANILLERIDLNTDEIHSFDSSLNIDLPVNQNISFNKTFTVSNNKQVTQPYWLATPMDGTGTFKVDDQRLIGSAESAPAYTARFTFKSKYISFTVKRPVQYKYTDPVRGEVYQPFVVITPIVVSLTPGVMLINVTNDNKQVINPKLSLQYKSNFSATQIPVTINIKQSEKVIYTKDTVVNFEAGKIYSMDLPVRNIFNNQLVPLISAQIIITVNNKPHVYEHYLRTIKYDHIPAINYFYKDNIHILQDEIKVAGKRIGYIIGAGDMVPNALLQLGYEVKYLSEADLTDANLKQFDAIIIGIRAYNIYEYLTNKNDVLNRFVQNGGNLIVQYLKSNQVGAKPIKAGPYHFLVNGGSRVTEENAKVDFILPDHPVLNYPNKITEKDFEGWVQERSTYQAEQLDPHFVTPLSMKDAGDRGEGKGSLAIAKYGKGNFVYMSLVLFRQLPAGVQGAYRLLANVIALQKN